jgi:ABC-type antimicrobial peptide transport system permease subunit
LPSLFHRNYLFYSFYLSFSFFLFVCFSFILSPFSLYLFQASTHILSPMWTKSPIVKFFAILKSGNTQILKFLNTQKRSWKYLFWLWLRFS